MNSFHELDKPYQWIFEKPCSSDIIYVLISENVAEYRQKKETSPLIVNQIIYEALLQEKFIYHEYFDMELVTLLLLHKYE